MSDQEQALCSIHQQPSIAVDLSSSVKFEQKFLCINCFAPQFANHIILNNQLKENMTDFKQTEFQNKKQLYELKLENYQQLCAKLQGYLDYFNESLNKILAQMNQQIEKLRNQMSNITSPNNQILKEDLILYIQSLQQEKNENEGLNSELDQESELDFLKLILEQIQKLQFNDQHKEIMKQIQQIMSEKVVNKEQIKNTQLKKLKKDDQPQKTLSLDYSCNRHGKEIIMTTLECDYKDERLFCAECLPEVTVKLTTLKEANNKWLIHQGQVYDSNNTFLNQREQRQSKTLEIISSYQQQNNQLQNELIQLLQKQNEIVQNDILNLEQTKNKQSLMQLDIEMVKTAINILSQKEQFTQAELQQKIIKLGDQQYEKALLNKLNEIEQIQINCKKNFQQLLNYNELLELDILINKFKIESYYKQLDSKIFMVLIPQLQNEIFNAFKEIMKQTIFKGQQYIGFLQKLEPNSNDQLQEKQNLQKYQSLQTELEKQFILLVGNKNDEDKQFQPNLNLTVNSQIIKFVPNKLKKGKIQVNQTNQTIQNLCVNNQIFTVATKVIKQFQFQSSQIKDIQFSYPYTKFNQPLKFSTTLKHSAITISADGKTAQSSTRIYYLCLCDQPIPKNGTVVVDFKVKQIQYLMAGICLKDSYNKDYVGSYRAPQGCYFLYTYPGNNNSYVWSHHDPNKKGVYQGFRFEQNDIISMEVNVQSKLISWRNKEKNYVYTLDIQTTSDLCFCFQLAGQSEIELV